MEAIVIDPLQDAEFDRIHQVTDQLYLTSAIGASVRSELVALGITHVLVCAEEPRCPLYPKDFEYKQLNIQDITEQDVYSLFGYVFPWMDDVLEKKTNRLLLHCVSGMSRAPTFTIGYLMYKTHAPYDVVYRQVKAARPIICPNEGFVRQLQRLESNRYRVAVGLLRSMNCAVVVAALVVGGGIALLVIYT